MTDLLIGVTYVAQGIGLGGIVFGLVALVAWGGRS